ncbi:MAG TPA: 4Fe-4S double cluster binding domain-containing protein [Spirochaetota bacterium]|nr:4Fe-4S double cluster binding domain-containing protein [Spirochaetota bacterium]HOL57153.1 4Fe-4S double cluster binding domain-containing protein [Spirochaetota bacterium]HPP03909.1 4Fe-4S double cluster binding domain-containing protein [Spirochaetota bacterium]
MQDLIESIKKEALNLGLDHISFGSVDRFEEFRLRFNDSFESPRNLFSEAKIYISAAISFREQWNLLPSSTPGYIARYTTANFYKILSEKLKSLARFCKSILNFNIKNSDFYRIFVNSKVNDKLAGYASGLGYYANNSLIFIEDKGTNFILGEIFLNLDLKIDNNNITNNFCRKCRVCIESCPTHAISENFKINKSLCLQYLSYNKDIPLRKEVVNLWGTRFFGCSFCIDNCPANKKNIKYNENYIDYPGYIGTTFDFNNLFNFSKEDYKRYFKGNQIGLSWVEPAVLARNILIALYNSNKKDLIIKYRDSITKYNWSDEEIFYLRNISDFLIKL